MSAMGTARTHAGLQLPMSASYLLRARAPCLQSRLLQQKLLLLYEPLLAYAGRRRISLDLPPGRQALADRRDAAQRILDNDSLIGGCSGLRGIIDSIFADLIRIDQVCVDNGCIDVIVMATPSCAHIHCSFISTVRQRCRRWTLTRQP